MFTVFWVGRALGTMPYREAGEWLRVRDASFGVHTSGASPGSISVQDKTPHSCRSLFSHLETGVDHLGHKGRLVRIKGDNPQTVLSPCWPWGGGSFVYVSVTQSIIRL